MNKTVSVWIMLADGENKGKIALQKRSVENKNSPFICQATWAGKVEPGEDILSAVKRECEEEMGRNFCENFNFGNLEEICKSEFIMNEEKWRAYNFLGQASKDNLEQAKVHKEALEKFIFVNEQDEIYSLKDGKNPKTATVLFDDQYIVFKKILDGTKRNNK